ncbi:3-hydroxyacyl-ACP dehydratase [Taibaiella lutea]|uniref:3-hydroxyacyl-ACP dehydratase n=1 Tax=Taibaiella lutea TaxID=2608001 RepID=A0A5M6CLW8_9BACT|nr:3-hydroxyacyl-ACP dehydratase [Taibaiella lutea]KAA5534972.1 3-hydroxyacyl-ACP dehydratase [Taibaiella lutea]
MEYIPQAAPFEMIDTLVIANETMSVTQFTIREGHLFVNNNHFSEPGLIENMAQTAAAGTGFYAAQNELQPPVGFIGAIKNFEVTQLPKIGDTIRTTTEVLHTVMNATIVQGIIHLNDEKIAEAEFKIFLEN